MDLTALWGVDGFIGIHACSDNGRPEEQEPRDIAAGRALLALRLADQAGGGGVFILELGAGQPFIT